MGNWTPKSWENSSSNGWSAVLLERDLDQKGNVKNDRNRVIFKIKAEQPFWQNLFSKALSRAKPPAFQEVSKDQKICLKRLIKVIFCLVTILTDQSVKYKSSPARQHLWTLIKNNLPNLHFFLWKSRVHLLYLGHHLGFYLNLGTLNCNSLI